MNNARAILVLLALLLAAVGANVWLDLSSAERAEVVRRRSLLRQSDHATAYEIEVPGCPTVRLEKSDCWRIVRPFNAVADQSGIARLSDALAFSPVVDSLEEQEAVRLGRTHEDFGLAEPRLKLKVETSGGYFGLDFGNRTHSGDGVYASITGIPTVYIVPEAVFAAVNPTVDAWRRRSVFPMSGEDVVSIDVRRGDAAAVRLERTESGWEIRKPRQALASSAAVNRMISAVLACEVRKFVWPTGATNETVSASVALLSGFGLDPENCETVVFHTDDGRDHSMSFGAVADADSVYALIQGGTTIATVPAAAKDSVSLDAGALIEGRLFPVEKSAVQRISLQDGDTAYLLAREENGQWRLDAPVSAAADEAVVSTLLDKLLVMRSADLDDHGVAVTLSDGMTPVSVSRQSLFGEAGLEQLRSKTVLDVDAVTVKRLVVTLPGMNRSSSVVYDPDRKGWSVESTGRSGVIDQSRLAALLKALSPLKAKAVVRLKASAVELSAFGLENPTCTVAVDRLIEGSVRRNIILGNRVNRSGDAYATVGSSDAVFIIDGHTVAVLTAGVMEE